MDEKTKRIVESILIPAALAIALLVTALWGASQSAQAKTYKETTQNLYTRAFDELVDTFADLDTTLAKLRVTDSPAQYMLLLDDVWRLSGTGVGLMSQLPQSHVDTAELNRFLVQLGDYAHTLSKKTVKGTAIGEDDTKQLDELYNTCTELSKELSDKLAAGDIPMAVITADEYYSSAAESEGYESEESIEKFPTLIYDGPFSESAEKQEPKGLTGGEISAEEAKRIAEEAAGISLEDCGTSDGTIPAYDFCGTYNDGRSVDISITRQGGCVLWLMSSSTGDREGLPETSESERYKETAKNYLSQRGYGEMQATYAQYYSGAALINFAAVQDGVILYNDLVKVWVDREDLSIVGVDARNYLFSHTRRELEKPAITEEEAKDMVSDNLEIKDSALALIPLTPNTECLCYEFKGTLGESEYIVYINANDGSEEQIFKIISDDNGQLVI